MTTDLPEAARRVVDAAAELGIAIHPIEFPEGTKTSAEAAAAVGADLAQIAKSLVFVLVHGRTPDSQSVRGPVDGPHAFDDESVLVLMSGDRRVDTSLLAKAFGADGARRATLDECRDATGFAAGGTPAFGHQLVVVADRSLQRNTQVWSAAGTPTTVYPIALEDLVSACGARWVDVAEHDGDG
jgi:prolyl-tRNA editing enzyme YbaK/EbsC (Cys-tRNA(Pro) deacylase)